MRILAILFILFGISLDVLSIWTSALRPSDTEEQFLIYSAFDGGDSDLYIMTSDGHFRRKIFSTPQDDRLIAAPQNGYPMLVSVLESYSEADIVVAPLFGQAYAIAETSDYENFKAFIGDNLFFERELGRYGAAIDIYAYDMRTRKETQLTDWDGVEYVKGVMGRGKWLFVENRTTQPSGWVKATWYLMRPDGSDLFEIPSGAWILSAVDRYEIDQSMYYAFQGYGEDGLDHIMRLNLDTLTLQEITTFDAWGNYESWQLTPDLEWLIFPVLIAHRSDLFKMHLSDVNIEPFLSLTAENDKGEYLVSEQIESWSPDGKWGVVSVSEQNSTSILYIVNLETGGIRQISQFWEDARFVIWSPDSEWIYYYLNHPIYVGGIGLKRVHVTQHRTESFPGLEHIGEEVGWTPPIDSEWHSTRFIWVSAALIVGGLLLQWRAGKSAG